MNYPHADDPVLCYVDNARWAYFTPVTLADQWGDDWNDAPYEHNAGEPYPDTRDPETGKHVDHKISRVGYWAPLFTPADRVIANSPYSVQDINRRVVPWLAPHEGWEGAIWAGTPRSEFVRLIQAAGGTAYIEASCEHPTDERE